MDVDEVALGDMAAAEIDRWRALAARASEPNPFLEPDLMLAAAATLAPPDSLRVVVVRDRGEWRLALPMTTTRRWRRIPVVAAQSWRHDYCFSGSPLVDRDAGADAFSALFQAMRRRRLAHRAVVLALDDVALGGSVAESLVSAAADARMPIRLDRVYQRALLRRRDDGGLPLDGMSGRHRRELDRLRRRLGADLGGEVELVDRAGDALAIGRFLELEASGWKGPSGTSTAFACRPGHDRFLVELCRRFAAQGRLRLWSLEAGGHSVAMLSVLRAGPAQFAFKWAFDAEHARWSPGRQLMIDVTRRVNDEPPGAWIDSCAAANNETINRLWDDRRSLGTVFVGLRGAVRTAGVSVLAGIANQRDRAASARITSISGSRG